MLLNRTEKTKWTPSANGGPLRRLNRSAALRALPRPPWAHCTSSPAGTGLKECCPHRPSWREGLRSLPPKCTIIRAVRMNYVGFRYFVLICALHASAANSPNGVDNDPSRELFWVGSVRRNLAHSIF